MAKKGTPIRDNAVWNWWVNNSKNVDLAKQLLKTCNDCSKFAKDTTLDIYLVHLQISLISYFSHKVQDQSTKNSLLNCVSSILIEMVTDGRAGATEVEYLVEELWVYHALPDSSPAATVAVESTCRALFSSWVMLSSVLIKQQKYTCCTSPHLSAAIMSSSASSSFLLSLISTSIQFLQKQASQKLSPDASFLSNFVEVRIIIASVIPFLLFRLSTQKTILHFAEVDKQSLQLIFAMFNIIPEDSPRQAYLSALFGPLCELYNRRGESDVSTLMCGKGVTHIARTHPNIFRQEIGLLRPEQSAILQNLMRLALQSMQTQATGASSPAPQGQGSGSSAGTPGSIKKLDMKKWNKK